ncbi:MAG: iron ABC transporter permease [Planctomycetes bacterium]|nr:iron ABC transporter permease [Planctomycetota bacterium]MBI3847982.1 iron ABC transporter permease [Planctomycetota bacterium]
MIERAVHLTPRKFAAVLALLVVLLVAALAIGLSIGAVNVFAMPDPEQAASIVREQRLPRVLLAALVGGALATAGAVLQALVRNPLASPYVLGISSGAALGAVSAIWLGLEVPILGVSPVSAFAFVGSLGALATVFAIARRGGQLPPHTLLLAGVVVNSIFSAAILFMNYVADVQRSQQIVRWLMGGIEWVRLDTALRAAPLIVLGAVGLCVFARPLNLLAIGEDPARALGVPVERIRLSLFVLTSLVTGVAVSVSGPIAFVGLIVPHALRFLFGADHRLLLPASFLGGAAFLVIGDTAARSVLASQEIPVGIVMALVGGPFFIWLLRRSLRGRMHG